MIKVSNRKRGAHAKVLALAGETRAIRTLAVSRRDEWQQCESCLEKNLAALD